MLFRSPTLPESPCPRTNHSPTFGEPGRGLRHSFTFSRRHGCHSQRPPGRRRQQQQHRDSAQPRGTPTARPRPRTKLPPTRRGGKHLHHHVRSPPSAMSPLGRSRAARSQPAPRRVSDPEGSLWTEGCGSGNVGASLRDGWEETSSSAWGALLASPGLRRASALSLAALPRRLR